MVNTGREEFASGGLTGTENPAFAPAESTDLAFMVGFFFSFRLGIVLFSVRILGTEASGGTALSLALDLLLLVFVCFDRMGFTRNSFGSMLRTGTVRWVAVFMALSLCSLVWSETGSMLNSAALLVRTVH